jgi:hypothetical protein
VANVQHPDRRQINMVCIAWKMSFPCTAQVEPCDVKCKQRHSLDLRLEHSTSFCTFCDESVGGLGFMRLHLRSCLAPEWTNFALEHLNRCRVCQGFIDLDDTMILGMPIVHHHFPACVCKSDV